MYVDTFIQSRQKYQYLLKANYFRLDKETRFRKLIHIDMDAFYASVEQLDNPELRGKPIAVGGSADRGVVAAASYEARRFNVHSALASKIAKRRCPDLIFIRPRFDRYKEVSAIIMNIFKSYTDLVEPLSLDEAYLDVTYNKKQCKSAIKIAMLIREEIRTKIGLTASAGVSFNKFLAKTASDIHKPDGLSVILPEQAIPFIKQLPIVKFHGIGKVTAGRMRRLGIFSGAELMKQEKSYLMKHFGKQGKHFHEIVHGNDHREVKPDRLRKSIGTEETFDKDILESEKMMQHLYEMVEKVTMNMKRLERSGKTVNVKFKFSDFTQIVRSKTLNEYTVSKLAFWEAVEEIMLKVELNEKSVRLLGVSISNLDKREEVIAKGQLTLDF